MADHMSLGNCKLKQWDATAQLLEWGKSKTTITANAGEDIEQQELSFIASGDEKQYRHFGRHLDCFL